MEQIFCQCCAMPMGNTEELYGTEADGSRSKDYCKYCYDNGKFTADCTMEEMIEFCVPHMASAESGIKEEDARKIMQEAFPKLKRWKQV